MLNGTRLTCTFFPPKNPIAERQPIWRRVVRVPSDRRCDAARQVDSSALSLLVKQPIIEIQNLKSSFLQRNSASTFTLLPPFPITKNGLDSPTNSTSGGSSRISPDYAAGAASIA